jgi:hypothetical protein
MKLFLFSSLLFLTAVSAEGVGQNINPYSVSSEFLLHGNTESIPSALENETILRVELGFVELGLENLFTYGMTEGESWYNELTFELSKSLTENLGAGAKYFLGFNSATQTHGAAFSLVPFWQGESLLLEDENEFAYDFSANASFYGNTFLVEYTVPALGLEWVLSLENELLIPFEKGSEIEDGLKFGPAAQLNFLNVGIYYTPTLFPELSHSFYVSLLKEF